MKYLIGIIIVLFLSTYCYAQENIIKQIKTEEKTQDVAQKSSKKEEIEYTYLGRKISKDQFSRYYKMFNTIVIIDKKPYDIGKSLYALKEREKGKLVLASVYMAEGMPAIGTFCESPEPDVVSLRIRYFGDSPTETISQTCKVLSVISKFDYLVMVNKIASNVKIIFHVTGVKNKLVDGSNFSIRKLICTGSYSYISAGGGKITVPSWRVYEPLTEDEFAAILKNGFQLSSYSLKEKKKDERGTVYQVVSTLIK